MLVYQRLFCAEAMVQGPWRILGKLLNSMAVSRQVVGYAPGHKETGPFDRLSSRAREPESWPAWIRSFRFSVYNSIYIYELERERYIYVCVCVCVCWLVVWIFLFFHRLGIVLPTDFHIFQRGRYTTNQYDIYIYMCVCLCFLHICRWLEIPGHFNGKITEAFFVAWSQESPRTDVIFHTPGKAW